VFSTAGKEEQQLSAVQAGAINNVRPQRIGGNRGVRNNPSSPVINDYLLALSLEMVKPVISIISIFSGICDSALIISAFLYFSLFRVGEVTGWWPLVYYG
jgi:hypothetical protein